MEENNTANTEQYQSADMLLEENYNRFIQDLKEGRIDAADIDAAYVSHEGYSEAVIRFKRQVVLESILDIVEKNLKMNVLYAVTSVKRRYYEAMAYSVTSLMTVITIQSYEYGVITSMTATFYQGYEPMYEMVTKKILSVEAESSRHKVKVLEKRNLKRIYKDFFDDSKK